MMNLKGKTIKGIKVIQHHLPKGMEKVLTKEQMKEYKEISESVKKLNPHRENDQVGPALANLQQFIRNTRMSMKPTATLKQTVEFEFPIPLNASTHIYPSGTRKIGDYPTSHVDVLELDASLSFPQVFKKMKEKQDQKVKKARCDQKKPRTPPTDHNVNLGGGNKFKYKLQAGCHSVSGDILRFKLAKGKPSVLSAKVPTTKDNHIGIEVEFVCKENASTLGLKLMVAGLGEWCHLKQDGSVRDESGSGYHSHELTVCVPEHKMEEVVDKICSILNEAGSKVNKTCGFHVHLDMRKRAREICFANLVSSQGIMYAMQPIARRDNRFCKKTSSKNLEEVLLDRGDGNQRYIGVNPHSLGKYNTLEIRIHTGTTNANKIKNWINLLIGIVNAPEVVAEEPKKAEQAGKLFNLKTEVVEYIKSRIEKFKDVKQDIENEDNGEAA